jgi:hypothetical protein
MFWKKLFVINMTILYIAIKVYLFIYSQYDTTDKYKNKIDSKSEILVNFENLYNKTNCNLSKIFEFNDKLIRKFDELRVNIYNNNIFNYFILMSLLVNFIFQNFQS